MRIEVQPAQTNGVERVKRFVNAHLHCIVSNLKRISKISTLPRPGNISADVHAPQLFKSLYHDMPCSYLNIAYAHDTVEMLK